MATLKEIQHFFRKGYLEYRQNLSVDCAIFCYHEGELQLLLVKNKIITKWCLPGGFVKQKENLDAAAARITVERTGIGGLFLKQFKTFGDPDRNKSFGILDEEKLYELARVKIEKGSWLTKEAVSVGFYSITEFINTKPQADLFSSECRWFPVDKLPKLGFDHEEMVREALHTMRIHLYHFPIGKNLLPEKFTLKEIKMFYETMSGKTLHVTNFPNKLISIGLIKKTSEKRKIGAHRSPTYYKFDEKAYGKALKEGLVLV
jgi:ADP-ribose pyrophosphatase YjhB (NUDIX family)